MHVCRGVNFTSLLFMNVYRIYILLVWFDKKGEIFLSLFMPFCWWFDKKEERNLEFYICMIISFPYFIQNGKEEFWEFIYACLFFNWYQSIYVLFMQKGEKYSSFMHICVTWFILSLNILIVYCYAWVKGELLWSLTLIHAYITP